jgi:hypothetical protein
MVSASAFSSGGITEEFDKESPALHSTATEQLHLLWIACGTDHRLIDINRKFREWLALKDNKHRGHRDARRLYVHGLAAEPD